MEFQVGDVIYSPNHNTVGEILEINGSEGTVRAIDREEPLVVDLRSCTVATKAQIEAVGNRALKDQPDNANPDKQGTNPRQGRNEGDNG